MIRGWPEIGRLSLVAHNICVLSFSFPYNLAYHGAMCRFELKWQFLWCMWSMYGMRDAMLSQIAFYSHFHQRQMMSPIESWLHVPIWDMGTTLFQVCLKPTWIDLRSNSSFNLLRKTPKFLSLVLERECNTWKCNTWTKCSGLGREYTIDYCTLPTLKTVWNGTIMRNTPPSGG